MRSRPLTILVEISVRIYFIDVHVHAKINASKPSRLLSDTFRDVHAYTVPHSITPLTSVGTARRDCSDQISLQVCLTRFLLGQRDATKKLCVSRLQKYYPVSSLTPVDILAMGIAAKPIRVVKLILDTPAWRPNTSWAWAWSATTIQTQTSKCTLIDSLTLKMKVKEVDDICENGTRTYFVDVPMALLGPAVCSRWQFAVDIPTHYLYAHTPFQLCMNGVKKVVFMTKWTPDERILVDSPPRTKFDSRPWKMSSHQFESNWTW